MRKFKNCSAIYFVLKREDDFNFSKFKTQTNIEMECLSLDGYKIFNCVLEIFTD